MEEFPLGNAVTPSARPKSQTPWRSLAAHLPAHVLTEILDGGQAFRWNRDDDGIWSGTWDRHAVRLRLASGDELQWQPLTGVTTDADLKAYLRLQPVSMPDADRLPWRSDPVLAKAMEAFPQLRLLDQALGETLLAFLCSSNKQIRQIKEMVALLARELGEPLAPGFHRLPSWDALARVPPDTLRACKLGYRARYIADTAAILAREPDWESKLETLDYPAAKAWMLGLPGVGEKVADCVLLFGAGKLEAFPVDTWILRIMQDAYQLENWKPAQIAHFGRVHFGPLAGLAQQFLFAWVRQQKPRQPSGPAARASARPVRAGRS